MTTTEHDTDEILISEAPPNYAWGCRHTLRCAQPRRLDLRPTTNVMRITQAQIAAHPEWGPGFCCHERTEENERLTEEARRLQAQRRS